MTVDLRGIVVRVADFAARELGSFVATQLVIARAARERLGLETIELYQRPLARRSA